MFSMTIKMKILAIIFCLLCSFNLFAQNNKHFERANDYYERFDYLKAIQFYEMAAEKDPTNPEISFKIGMSYRSIGDLVSSGIWFEKAIKNGHTNSICSLYLAEAKKADGKYADAIHYYKMYSDKMPKDSRAINHLRDTSYYHQLLRTNPDIQIKNLGVNDDGPAFGVTSFEDKFIFSSPAEEGVSIKESGIWTEMPYLDLFVGEKGAGNELVNIQPLEGIINSRFHDGPASFDPTNKILYITRNNIVDGKPLRDNTGTVNLKIYQAKRENAQWTDLQELGFNSDEFSNAHPCVTYDGTALFFISNRPGGFGGTDIYKCLRLPNGTWDKPQNLGNSLNTPGNEMFPYIHTDGTLYFASDGHAGLGGLDMFNTTPLPGSNDYSMPINPGSPINTCYDDFGMMFEANTNQGYFSSNRDGGIGNDDIFWFEDKSTQPQSIFASIKGEISKNNPVKILCYEKGSDEATDMLLTKAGIVQFKAEPGKTYLLIADNGETLPLTEYKVPANSSDLIHDLGEFIIPAKSDLAQTPDLNPKVESIKKPDLPKTEPVKEPVLTVEKPVDPTVSEYTTSDLLERKKLKNIYFDYNKSDVRADAVVTLNEIIRILKDSSEYRLEIRAHADKRGSVDYNRELSKRRAEEARKYLLSRGISDSKIVINWYGATEQIEANKNETLSEEQIYQLNRRAEFRIIVD